MNSGLRKTHKIIWILLVIIVPIVLIFTIKDLENFTANNKNIKYDPINEAVIKSAENHIFKIALTSNYLEVILKKPLKSSSAILKDQNNAVVGQISTVGIYKFEASAITKLTIVDALKNETITQIKLK